MPSAELTFEAVDDLTAAYARGKLDQPAKGRRFAPVLVAPLIELAYSLAHDQSNSLLNSAWLDPFTQADLRAALCGKQSLWLDSLERRGFMRTVYDPLIAESDLPRTRFLMAARKSAEATGLPVSAAQYMAAAMRELESNIWEHSEKSQTGLLAFQASHGAFEFVAADNGVGVLATLRDATEFKSLSDHGRALYLTLQEGVSRHGRDPNHGNGFRDLFRGLHSLNADLRFRSGDHALTISGVGPELRQAQLAQKSTFRGFLASVHCRSMISSNVTH
jgi:hypothetical protein